MKSRLNAVTFIVFVTLMTAIATIAAIIPTAIAHTNSGEAYVRVVSADPATRTYTFSCTMDPDNDYLRDWSIRPDTGNTANTASNEAEINDLEADEFLTYTFEENEYYHVGCQIVDESDFSTIYRGDLHIDLRNTGWNPEIIPLNSNGLTSTLECKYSGGGSPSWKVLNAMTGESETLSSGNPLTHTADGHGLYDYFCTIGGVSTGYPVEYFDSGDPYFADDQGVPHGITTEWIRGADNNETDNETDPDPVCGNDVVEAGEACDDGNNLNGDGCSSVCTVEDIDDSNDTDGDSGPVCIENVQNLPASCTGTITSDTYDGCRNIACEEGSSSLQILACDKPDGNSPQYFEMYRKASAGSGVEICLGDTCLSESGFARSTDYPYCSDDDGNVTDGDGNGDGNVTDGDGNGTDDNDTQACYDTLGSIPAECTGGSIAVDDKGACRSIVCSGSSGSLQVLACPKEGSGGKYFEMYRQSEAEGIEICLADNCISNNGFVKSGNFPVCTAGSSDDNNTDDGSGDSNSTIETPVWLEPVQGQSDADPFSFIIHVFPMENDSEWESTDFEIYDQVTGERVWLADDKINLRLKGGDGVFEGSLAGSNHLLFDHNYRTRARHNTESGVGPWSEWVFFKTREEFSGEDSDFTWTAKEGFTVELVASGVSMPVTLEMAPDIYGHLPESQRPLLYFTQLYGQVGVILNDGTYVQYADDILNYETFGSLPGSGEMGVIGLYADETTGDLFVSSVYHDSAQEKFFGQVERYFTDSNGIGFSGKSKILTGIPVSTAHQVQELTRGPDGKLYLGTGDADDPQNSDDPNTLYGKILRFNDDGSMPSNNPFPGTYVYAAGFRNPFGHEWHPMTSKLFVTNNGEDSDDSVYKVDSGDVFGWCQSTCDTTLGAWNVWPQTVVPTAIDFDDGNSGFPSYTFGDAFMVKSGPANVPGQVPNGKKITRLIIDSNGNYAGEEELVTYTGDGFGTPLGLTFGNDGLYFSDLLGEEGFVGAGITRGNIYKIVQGEQISDPVPDTGEFKAALGQGRWYPQGLNMIWTCSGSGGSGDYRYDYHFGDGNSQTNTEREDVYYTYSSPGTYSASCTVYDQQTGLSATASSQITLGDAGSGNSSSEDSGSEDTDTGGTNSSGDTGSGSGDPACFHSVQHLKATCNGGSITVDKFNGCRTVACASPSGNQFEILACDKPDGMTPKYYEIYSKSDNPGGLEICLGPTCLKDQGFIKSSEYPICE